MSALAAASAGDFAAVAPSFASFCAFSAVRFHTVSGNPAFKRFAAIGEPISPNPINATRGFITASSHPVHFHFKQRTNIAVEVTAREPKFTQGEWRAQDLRSRRDLH